MGTFQDNPNTEVPIWTVPHAGIWLEEFQLKEPVLDTHLNLSSSDNKILNQCLFIPFHIETFHFND